MWGFLDSDYDINHKDNALYMNQTTNKECPLSNHVKNIFT